MAVKIRLARHGAKKSPFYRIVVADARSPRDGAFIDRVGTYDPRTNPSDIKVDNDKAREWISKGAQPTDQVRKLLKISGAL
ncbi:MAG TPA: 30S ribosomal protein S16 [Actinomycetota bacterium]|jgi:small subunit ribosomal protein S16|nr:30S ribosomal protein S16 [Actinomycetota bacterium]